MSSIGKRPAEGNAASEAAVPDPLTPAAGTSPEQDRKPEGNADPTAIPSDPSKPSNGMPPGDDRKPTKQVEWFTAVIAALSLILTAVVAFYTYNTNSRLAEVQTDLAEVQTDLTKAQRQLTQAQIREHEHEARGEVYDYVFAATLEKYCNAYSSSGNNSSAIYSGYVWNPVLAKVEDILKQCNGTEPNDLDYLLVFMEIKGAASKFAPKVTIGTREIPLLKDATLADYDNKDGKRVSLASRLSYNQSVYIPIALMKDDVPGLAPVIVPKWVSWHSPVLNEVVKMNLDFPPNQYWVAKGASEWRLAQREVGSPTTAAEAPGTDATTTAEYDPPERPAVVDTPLEVPAVHSPPGGPAVP